jgi:hypothetical protein
MGKAEMRDASCRMRDGRDRDKSKTQSRRVPGRIPGVFGWFHVFPDNAGEKVIGTEDEPRNTPNTRMEPGSHGFEYFVWFAVNNSGEKSRVNTNNRLGFGKNRQKKPVNSLIFANIRFASGGGAAAASPKSTKCGVENRDAP